MDSKVDMNSPEKGLCTGPQSMAKALLRTPGGEERYHDTAGQLAKALQNLVSDHH